MNTPKHSILSVGQILLTSFYVLIFPILVLFLSGDWYWLEGWLFAAWYVSVTLSTLIYLYRNDPALLQERFKQPGAENEKKWDQYFMYAIQIFSGLGSLSCLWMRNDLAGRQTFPSG